MQKEIYINRRRGTRFFILTASGFDFETYYQIEYRMHKDIGYSIDEFENMIPYEVIIRLGLHKERVEQEEQIQSQYRKEIDRAMSKVKI